MQRVAAWVLRAADPPEDSRLDRHRWPERALRAQRCQAPPMRSASRGPNRPGVRIPMACRSCPLALGADFWEGRGRCDAPRTWLRRRGLGCGAARMSVTTPPTVGGARRAKGSGRRQYRPPDQWRQGVCKQLPCGVQHSAAREGLLHAPRRIGVGDPAVAASHGARRQEIAVLSAASFDEVPIAGPEH